MFKLEQEKQVSIVLSLLFLVESIISLVTLEIQNAE